MSTQHDNAHHLAQLLKVIADETRLRILGLLAERDHNGRELSNLLDLTPPTISHHIRKLVSAGIVTATPDAQQQRYALNNQLLLDARAMPLKASRVQEVEGSGDEERARARVLRNFFEGERLKTIPAQRKQRVIVLQHLLQRFDPNRSYVEPEINEMLRQAHEDVATLRRELVDYGFMVRDRGIYEVARHPPPRSQQVAQEITGDEAAWLRALVESTLHPQVASRADDDARTR